MLLYFYSVQDPPSRSALYPTLRSHHHPLAILSSFLWVLTGVHGRRGPTFDTVSFSNLTPCNPVTFSWTGGVPPFSLVIYNDNTGDVSQEFDAIEVNSFSWTPPQRAVRKLLFAAVFDDDDFEDDTNDFVVQSASCFSVSSSATQTTPVISPPIVATPSSTQLSATPSTLPSSSHLSVPSPPAPSNTSAPSSAPGSSSSSSQSLSRASSTSQLSNSTIPPPSTTGAASSTERSTSSPSLSSTTSTERSTSRPRRKSSVSPGEVAGIVLGAVAILAMLVALLVWRWAMRRRGAESDRAPADDDKYTALPSSLSTQHESSLSSKAAMRRHAYASTSPTTTTASGVAMGAPSLLHAHDEHDAGAILHVHDRNSLGVEPPTPPVLPRPINHLQQSRPLLHPISGIAPPLAPADEVKARARGDQKTTEPAVVTDALPEVEVGSAAGTEARGELHAQDELGIARELLRGNELDAKSGNGDGDGDGQGAFGPHARPVTVVESDAGVRLAGGPPGLDLLNNSDCAVVTTLPPPYHRYDS